MTITTLHTSVSYTGDGATVAFPVTFQFFNASDLIVYERVIATGVATLKTITTDYTVTGGNGLTGTVTAVSAPANTVKWEIYRKTARTQEVDLQPLDDLPAETLEDMDDRGVLIDQEIEARSVQIDLAAEGWDAGNRRIINVATPAADSDAATKEYVDDTLAASGNVPAPADPGDNGKILTANSGTFAWGAAGNVPTPADPGDDNKVLTASGGDFTWESVPSTSLTPGSVGTTELADNAVTTVKIINDAVTLAKLEHGTRGDILYYGASGAPARLGFGNSGHVLKTQGTGADPIWQGQEESIIIACSDETTALTAGTAKVTFRMPYGMNPITEVFATLTTAQSSGNIFTVDINKNGVSILSTKITIDNNEKQSQAAAIPPVLSDTAFVKHQEVSIDIDQIGNGTATGLKVMINGRRT
jgi:hypothetical protein